MPVPTAEMAADLGEPGVLRRRALPPNGVTRAEAVNEKMGQDAIWEHKRGGDKFGKSEDSGLSNTLSTSRSPPSAPRHKDPSPSYTAIMFRIFAGCCLNVSLTSWPRATQLPDFGMLK